MNPTFSKIDFYDYKIRMCEADGTKMYLVSDLLRQYNEKHGTNKRFAKYLENKQSQEVIEHMAKRTQNTGGPNSDLQYFESFSPYVQSLLVIVCFPSISQTSCLSHASRCTGATDRIQGTSWCRPLRTCVSCNRRNQSWKMSDSFYN